MSNDGESVPVSVQPFRRLKVAAAGGFRMTMNDSPPPKSKRRQYRLSPDRFIIGLLAVEGILFLSEQLQLFPFNERKGWTVLIAVAAVCLAVVVMLLWFVASLLLRWRFQFSLRSLVILVVATAIPCCWLAMRIRQAETQRQTMEAIGRAGGSWLYDHGFYALTGLPEPPVPAWLVKLFGIDFFSNVDILAIHQGGDEGLRHAAALDHLDTISLRDSQITNAGLRHLNRFTELDWLNLSSTQITDAGLEHLRGLMNLRVLHLRDTQVTDAGLEHLKGLTSLESLNLSGTQVTERGIVELQQALPNCEIER